MFQKANMVVLKITRGCNFRCKYCYLGPFKDDENKVMDFDLFKIIIDRVVQERLKYKQKNKITFVLHGGEPLMAGYENINKMLNYIKDVCKSINYAIGIQTNLSLLDEKLFELLLKFNVDFGLSYDGFGNEARSRTFGRKQYEEKIKMLKRKGLDVSFLVVINKHNINKINKTVNYLRRKFNVKRYKMNYVIDIFGDKSIEVSGKDYFNKVLKYFIDRAGGAVSESNANMLIELYMTGALLENADFFNNQNCMTAFCGAGINVIEIEPDGQVLLCGRYSEPTKDNTLCHITEKSFLDIQVNKKLVNYARIKHELLLQLKCDECLAYDICDKGCMAFYYSRYGMYGIQTDIICDIYKTAFTYLQNNEYKILERLFLNNKKYLTLKLHGKGTALRSNRFSLVKLKAKHGAEVEYNAGRNILIIKG